MGAETPSIAGTIHERDVEFIYGDGDMSQKQVWRCKRAALSGIVDLAGSYGTL